MLHKLPAHCDTVTGDKHLLLMENTVQRLMEKWSSRREAGGRSRVYLVLWRTSQPCLWEQTDAVRSSTRWCHLLNPPPRHRPERLPDRPAETTRQTESSVTQVLKTNPSSEETVKSAPAASHLDEEQFGFSLHRFVVKVSEDTRQPDGIPVSSEHAVLVPVRRQDGQKTVVHRPPALCSRDTQQHKHTVNSTLHSVFISHCAERRREHGQE